MIVVGIIGIMLIMAIAAIAIIAMMAIITDLSGEHLLQAGNQCGPRIPTQLV